MPAKRFRIGISLLVAGLACQVGPSQADTIFVEETIGESLAHQVGDAILKAQDVARDKAQANAQFDRARSAFYVQLNRGLLKTREEAAFAELLNEKDIYYLSLYASEGVQSADRRVKAIDTLTGGEALDGGIGGWPVSDHFEAWVRAVRAQLGATREGELLFVSDPTQFRNAILQAQSVYENYRHARDQAEFERWHLARRVPAPAARTPADFAQRYIVYVLKPSLAGALSRMPPAQRQAMLPRVRAWLISLGQAIAQYESAGVTPDTALIAMKAAHYPAESIAFFQQRLGNVRGKSPPQVEAAVIQAYSDAIMHNDMARYGASLAPNPDVVASQLRDIAVRSQMPSLTPAQRSAMDHDPATKQNTTNRTLVDYLLGPGEPFKFKRDSYAVSRRSIASGTLLYEPPLPAFRVVNGVAAPALATPSPSGATAAVGNPSSPDPASASPSGSPPAKVAPTAVGAAVQPAGQPPTVVSARPFNAGILGVHLGMSVAVADGIVRAALKPQAVIDIDPKAWGASSHPFLTGRVFISPGATDRVALFWIAGGPQRIVSISRRLSLPVPGLAADQVRSRLARKFGSPAVDGANQWFWSGRPDLLGPSDCRAINMINALGNGFVYSSGRVTSLRGMTSAASGIEPAQVANSASGALRALANDAPGLISVQHCPATLWAYYLNGPNDPYLRIGIVDGGYTARLSGRFPAQAADP